MSNRSIYPYFNQLVTKNGSKKPYSLQLAGNSDFNI